MHFSADIYVAQSVDTVYGSGARRYGYTAF